MRLIEILPNSDTANALAPEELAAVVLRHLNDMATNDPSSRHREVPIFNIRTYCNDQSQAYQAAQQTPCAHALSAAWMHLAASGMLALDPAQGNGWYFLTPRARALRTLDDYERYKSASLFPRGELHTIIEHECYAEFLRGDYETAVFKAFKAIEVQVRRAIQAEPETIGKELMVKAFHPQTGVLTDQEEVAAEREALMFLFVGAIGRFKNPSSHREVSFDHPGEAIEAIQFASLLMRIVWVRLMRQEGFSNINFDAGTDLGRNA